MSCGFSTTSSTARAARQRGSTVACSYRALGGFQQLGSAALNAVPCLVEGKLCPSRLGSGLFHTVSEAKQIDQLGSVLPSFFQPFLAVLFPTRPNC